MLDFYEPPVLSPDELQTIDFFQDFTSFLTYLQKEPIRRTKIGNISLSSVKDFLPSLKTTRKRIDEFRMYGWPMRSEDYLPELTQIKILSEVMHLTYTRKNVLYLSRRGSEFLKHQTPLEQYTLMVLHYWYRINWDYFSPTATVEGISLSEKLQQSQNQFWKLFLGKKASWIDFVHFCEVSCDYLNLHPFIWHSYDATDHGRYLDLEYSLIKRNLLLFGCVEIEEEKKKTAFGTEKALVKFRPTKPGLYVFYKALYENPLQYSVN